MASELSQMYNVELQLNPQMLAEEHKGKSRMVMFLNKWMPWLIFRRLKIYSTTIRL